jgi:hypothetical protein
MIYLILAIAILVFSVFLLACTLIKKNSIISNLTADKTALKKYISDVEAQIADSQKVRDELTTGAPADRFAHSLDVMRHAAGNTTGNKNSVADTTAASGERKPLK